MAKYLIKATAMVRIQKEIEAPSKEEAESIFYDANYGEIISNADRSYVSDISTDEVETTRMTCKVYAYDIDYDVDDKEEAAGLPEDLILWFEVNGDPEDDTVDFDGVVNDAIEEETGWSPKGFRYKVLEAK